MDKEETQKYVEHRLGVVARAKPIFTKKAMADIFNYSGGIPGRINRPCDMCLLAGFVTKVEEIDQDIVSEEIKGLE